MDIRAVCRGTRGGAERPGGFISPDNRGIVAAQAAVAGVPCQVSLERLMACGIGACLSCVVSTRNGRMRACVDGPVFDAEEVLWDASEVPPKH